MDESSFLTVIAAHGWALPQYQDWLREQGRDGEAEGVVGECDAFDDRKVVARRARLLREVTAREYLAQVGTSRPQDCKFPVAVDQIFLTEAIEIIAVTPQAWACIQKVPVWTE